MIALSTWYLDVKESSRGLCRQYVIKDKDRNINLNTYKSEVRSDSRSSK